MFRMLTVNLGPVQLQINQIIGLSRLLARTIAYRSPASMSQTTLAVTVVGAEEADAIVVDHVIGAICDPDFGFPGNCRKEAGERLAAGKAETKTRPGLAESKIRVSSFFRF